VLSIATKVTSDAMNLSMNMMKLVFSIVLVLCIALEYVFLSNPVSENKNENHDLKFEANTTVASVKSLQNITNYNAIVERPLFIEERRFEEEKKEEKVVRRAPVIQDLRVQALGVALSGDGLLAVIKDLKNGQTKRLHIGDDIYGWVLKGVSESSFTFSKDKREKVVKFKE
jgi:hypothetical protein